MVVCLGYTRRSTAGQEDSQATQEEHIRRWCADNGHECLDVLHEAPMSASVPVDERPVASGLFRRVAQRGRGFDAIVVLAVDRMFRDPTDEFAGLAYLAKYECRLVSIRDPIDLTSPVGELQQGIMAVLRRFERRLIGQRVREKQQTRLRQGLLTHGVMPMGLRWDNEQQLAFETEDAWKVRRVFELYVETGGSCKTTAERLRAEGIGGRNGGLMEYQAVARAINNPCYRQCWHWNGQEVPAPDRIPRIVPAELVDAAVALFKANSRIHPRQRDARPYAGLLTCSECGAHLTVRWSDNTRPGWEGFRKAPRWFCQARTHRMCNGRGISERYLDRMIGKALHIAVSQYADAVAEWATQLPDVEREGADRRIKRLEERRLAIVDAWVARLYSDEQRDERLRDIDAELAELREGHEVRPIMRPEAIADVMRSFEAEWGDWPMDARRVLLHRLGVEVVVNTGERPNWIRLRSDLPLDEVYVEMGCSRKYRK